MEADVLQTTVGIPILIVLLRLTTGLVSFTPWGKPAESIQTGNYGNPPNAWWWLKQSVIYFVGLFGMKISVLVLFLMLPWISQVGDWALKWTEGNERLQIVFVMMLFPLIMNALQYYIIDSFIKNQAVEHDLLPQRDDGAREAFDDVLDDSDDDFASSDGSSEELRLSKSRSFKGDCRTSSKPAHGEYNPDLDGQPVRGDSRDRAEQGGLLPKELDPPE